MRETSPPLSGRPSTRRKIAGSELQGNPAAGLPAALVAMTEGVMAVDGEQRILLWNRAAERLFGISADEVLGLRCCDVIRGRDRSGIRLCRRTCHAITLAKQRQPIQTSEILTLANGRKQLSLSAMCLTLRPAGDDPMVLAVIFRDVSAHKQREQAVRQLSAAVARLLHEARLKHGLVPASAEHEVSSLSPREDQVLERLRQGFGTRTIADQLGVSPATVKNHVQHIFSKLGAHNRLEAVSIAGRRQHHD